MRAAIPQHYRALLCGLCLLISFRGFPVYATPVLSFNVTNHNLTSVRHNNTAHNATALALEGRQQLGHLPRSTAAGTILCHPASQNWGSAKQEVIWEGIDYLQQDNRVCGADAGPGNCDRVSCSYGSGIFLCNDNTFPITLPCSLVAEYAYPINSECVKSAVDDGIAGQAFSVANWNVVVRGAGC